MAGGTNDVPDTRTRRQSIRSPLITSFVAGSVSASISATLLQPLELVKTRLQKSDNLGSKLGMIKEIRNVVKQERVRSLWNGLVPSLYRTVPGVGIYFTSLHAVRSTFGSINPHPLESIVIGASCRSFAGIMVLPFTVMKVRYESGEFVYKGLRHALQTTHAKEGFRGLFLGLAPTLMRDVPYSGLYLMFYTNLKSFTSDFAGQYVIPVNFCNGILAACFSSFFTQPVDVIKTQMQLYPSKFSRIKLAIIHIYQERGLLGFQRGFMPRTLRRTLMSSMTWSVYEEVMRKYHIKI